MAKQKKAQSKAGNNNEVRSKVDGSIQQGAVVRNHVDLYTLKRKYPKRFISDIEENEGYEKIGFNRWIKK